MALGRTTSAALVGVEGALVGVEADIGPGLPGYTLVGLPDTALHESRDRVRAAIVNSGCSWPDRRITVGLSPADLPKSGSHFDLAVAVAILGAAGAVDLRSTRTAVLLGELGLDGRVRAVRGVLPALLGAVRAGRDRALVPAANVAEAQLVPGLDVLGVATLAELIARLNGDPVPDELPDPAGAGVASGLEALASRHGGGSSVDPFELDLVDVGGQAAARFAVEVAAAGGHHLSLLGPPGIGKTMLAERLPGLLPDLGTDEALEVAAIRSVAGLLGPSGGLSSRPPFSAPHHTATVAALVGGGARLPRPGAVSLAHRGVLFLDEAPEFAPAALDALRQPLERGEVVLARSAATVRFPARFQLVLAANPCPCGRFTGRGEHCSCPPVARRRYTTRVSGPVRDRVDIHQILTAPSRAELQADSGSAETSAVVRGRVGAARERQLARLAGTPWRSNGEIPGPELRRRWPVSADAQEHLGSALAAGTVTARGADRIARVAWTLADLAAVERPGLGEIRCATALRGSAGGPR
jgi:magnesium chelatase family protein